MLNKIVQWLGFVSAFGSTAQAAGFDSVQTPVLFHGQQSATLCVPVPSDQLTLRPPTHPVSGGPETGHLVRELYENIIRQGTAIRECGYTVCDGNGSK
ncbi:MAG: hypothetical protein JNL01_14455 [Bdellovibrionales bacterium]|nr:hypothetical protein [Bdellovibrionales bacterium]